MMPSRPCPALRISSTAAAAAVLCLALAATPAGLAEADVVTNGSANREAAWKGPKPYPTPPPRTDNKPDREKKSSKRDRRPSRPDRGGGAGRDSDGEGPDGTPGPAEKPKPVKPGQGIPSDDDDAATQLGAVEPLCEEPGITAAARGNCKRSGAMGARWPLDRYMFDWHVDTGVFGTSIAGNLIQTMQAMLALLWTAALWLYRALTMILQAGFSLDYLNSPGPARLIDQAVQKLHTNVLGQPWMIAALGVLGLWAIWRGLVQRQIGSTLAGIGASVLMVVAALVVIANPAGTAGQVSHVANQAALGALSGATTGQVSSPHEGYSQANVALFETMVVSPFCALQMGEVRFCTSRPPADLDVPDEYKDDVKEIRRTPGGSVADLWLKFPANGDEREDLYEHWKDHDKYAKYTSMQKGGGLFRRFALLGLICLGLVGMFFALGWLTLRLVAAAVMSFVLLIVTPVALIAACFGEGGRELFVNWAKRLAGALIAKFVFAVFLAVVLAGAMIIASLGGRPIGSTYKPQSPEGWYVIWNLLAAYWWLIFLYRKRALAMVNVTQPVGDHAPRDGLGAAAKAYVGFRVARDAVRAVSGKGGRGGAGGPAAGRSAMSPEQAGQVRAQATGEVAHERLTKTADDYLNTGRRGAADEAHRADKANRAWKQERGEVAAGLSEHRAHERARRHAARTGTQPPPPRTPTEEERGLLKRWEQLKQDRPNISKRQAAAGQALAGLTPAQDGKWSDQQRQQALAEIAALKAGPPGPQHAQLAGYTPQEYNELRGGKKAATDDKIARALADTRAQMHAVPAGGHTPSAEDLDVAERTFDPKRLRDRQRDVTERVRSHEAAHRHRRHVRTQ